MIKRTDVLPLKHAKAKHIVVNIAQNDKKLSINIKDDGCGFDKNRIFEGNGLKNFQNRAKNNDIEVMVESGVGVGTEVKIELKTFK